MPILSSKSLLRSPTRLAHPQCCCNGPVWCWESRHHRIADRFDDGPAFAGDYVVDHQKMSLDQIIGDQIAHSLIKLGRALQVGEEESETGYFESLRDIERIGAIDVAERLVRE